VIELAATPFDDSVGEWEVVVARPYDRGMPSQGFERRFSFVGLKTRRGESMVTKSRPRLTGDTNTCGCDAKATTWTAGHQRPAGRRD
jgi:hypothetical protein